VAAATQPQPGVSRRQTAPQRLQDPLAYERGFWSRGIVRVAGVDEAGRGPLAGPVVAAAVILPPGTCIDGVDDSKRLLPRQRAALVGDIRKAAVAIAVGAASARVIDRVNIRVAAAYAMKCAVTRLAVSPDHLLVDGLPMPELGHDTHTAIVDGDRLVHSIACASILAKVLRDHLMDRLACRYPVYGWERNRGYATPEHLRAIERNGPSPHHRRSFRPVSQLSFVC
jgi:ribonuclease HII